MTAIPVIGLDGDEVKVASEISRACTEVGFFVVRDHGIDRKVFDDAYEESMDFFRRPVAQKNSYPMRTSTARGDNDYSPYGYSALLAENAYAYTGRPGMPADYVEKFSAGRLVLDDPEDLPFPEDDRGAALRSACPRAAGRRGPSSSRRYEPGPSAIAWRRLRWASAARSSSSRSSSVSAYSSAWRDEPAASPKSGSAETTSASSATVGAL